MGYDLARVTEQARNALEAMANARRELSEMQTVCHRARRQGVTENTARAALLTEAYQGAWDAESEISIMEETLKQWVRRWEFETLPFTALVELAQEG